MIYLATTNAGKVRDFAAGSTQEISMALLLGMKNIPAPAEDKDSFEGNARVKAIYYSRHVPGEIVVADDSGLEVESLDYAPGVRSARYAEDEGYFAAASGTVDERNNLTLLSAMRGVDGDKRQARYRCALAAARDGEVLCVGSGTVAGLILEEPRGEGGFGYDPLFYLPEYKRTMAELDAKTKFAVNHRGRAFAALLEVLRPHLDEKKR
jgi:XTP/dITP diphosphohydrolase